GNVLNFINNSLAALVLALLASGCVAAPSNDPTNKVTALKQISPFDPAAARTFMDGVTLESPGRIAPVFSADGTNVAFVSADELRVIETSSGEPSLAWTMAQLAALVGAEAEDISVRLESEPFEAVISSQSKAARLPLLEGAEPIEEQPQDPPRMVRSMFPMNGYDRRENLSPDGRYFASLDGLNLAIRTPGSDNSRVITQESNPRRMWFHGNDIWEQSRTIWSPDSLHFVARLHDSTETPGIDLIDYLEDGDSHSVWTYWARAGQPLPRTELYAVNAETGTRTRLGPAGTTNDHLFFSEWAPDGTSVLSSRYSRDLSRQDIFSIDTTTGETRTIVTRVVEDGWVKWPGGAQTIQHLPNGGFLLRSDEDGYFQYYTLDERGSVITQLTNGEVDVGDVVGFDPNDDWLYFLSPVSSDRPYDQIPHRVPLSGGPAEPLSSKTGVHRASLSPDGRHLVTVHADFDRASQADLITADGTEVVTLASTKTPENIQGLPLPEPFTVTAADGVTVIHGTLMKPRDFDPAKTYPVIHRVYGAMQSRVQRSGFWSEGLGYAGSEYHTMLNYFADAGYIVVLMDAPGSPGRGREYTLKHWGNWPGSTPDDYAAGLMNLAETRPWMDTSRIGIDGNSWGGYVALYSALELPDIYKTVSISVPETDLIDHVHWIEWQIGTRENNPDVYAKGNLADRSKELQSDIIIVSGTSDVNVPISNTMKLLDGLAEAGKPYDLVLFPGTNHPHQGRGDRYAYAVERIRMFHDTYLKPTTDVDP
ncbi:MAG: prolyl oligopeptidase family serine peptidase, partial [Pseudomonadota bacterium]